MPLRPPVHAPRFAQLPGHAQAADRDRGSAARRGYDRKWQAFRSAVLAAHPLCVDCRAAGQLAPATELHHIARLRQRPDLRLDPGNVMGLCASHHSARTARGE